MSEGRLPARLVVDTNVLVSGLISSVGPPAVILREVRANRVVLVMCDAMMDELLRVLEYPKLKRYLNLVEGVLDGVAALLLVHVERIEPLTAYDLSADPDDNVFVDTAVAGKVNALVTGDKGHLLGLKDVMGVPVVSARACVEELLPGWRGELTGHRKSPKK